MNRKFTAAAAAVFALTLSAQAFAASSGIMSDRQNECAIWLCLPGGFAEGCSASYSSYIKRITSFTGGKHPKRKYTDLPKFDLCVDENPPGIEDYNVEKSEITYNSAYEVHMPAYNTCTSWKRTSCGHSGCSTTKKCKAVKTTAARTFISDEKYHSYSTINVGDTEYTTKYAPTRLYSEVLVDGEPVGSRWYNDLEDNN